MAKEIFLTGIVDQWMAEDLRWDLMNSSEPIIDIYISCMGGDVNKGFEIANLIQAIQAGGKTQIHTFNLSHADSIATVIFLAADQANRHIVDSSTLFTHDPRFMWIDDVTKDIAIEAAKELEIQTNRIADFYVKNIAGLDKDEALTLMSEETNMTAQKMLDLGIVSEVLESFNIAAQRSLITNQNNNQMGLFKNKQPIFALKMADETILVHEGELIVGSEVQKDGVIDSLEGDHIDAEGRTIKIGADNKVTEIVAKVADPAPVPDPVPEPILDEVAAILVNFEEKITAIIDTKISAIRGVGSDGKIPKINDTKKKVDLTPQETAAVNVRERMAKIQAAKKDKTIK